LRWCKPVGSARLHLDEAENVVIISDEIDLSVYECAAKVSSDGQSEVGGDQTIAELFEIGGCVRFTELAE
jgi:hypothetical protein